MKINRKIVLFASALIICSSVNAKENSIVQQRNKVILKTLANQPISYSLVNASYNGNSIVYDGTQEPIDYGNGIIYQPFFAIQADQKLQIGQNLKFEIKKGERLNGYGDNFRNFQLIFSENKVTSPSDLNFVDIITRSSVKGSWLYTSSNGSRNYLSFLSNEDYDDGKTGSTYDFQEITNYPQYVEVTRTPTGYSIKLGNQIFFYPSQVGYYPTIFGGDYPNSSYVFEIN